MATIDDVARLAAVGPTTVSHALSGKRHVAPATRARILAAVSALGYQPNAAARSLVSRRTMTVGLIVPLDLNILAENRYTDFIIGIGDRLNELGYSLLCLIDRNPVSLDVQRLLRSSQVDGALLLQVRTVDARITALMHEGRPFVGIGRPRDAGGVTCVDSDFARAAGIAVEHLLTLGHRKIGFLTTGQDGMPVFGFQWHSLQGFRRAHQEHRVALDEAQILYHDQETIANIAAALAPILDSTLPITALVTTTFISAALVLQVLAAHQLRVPEDFSIVALGEPRDTMMAVPSITVVRFSVTDLAYRAVNVLVGILNSRQPDRHEHLVPVELAVRGSSGPPIDGVVPAIRVQPGADHAASVQAPASRGRRPRAPHVRKEAPPGTIPRVEDASYAVTPPIAR